MTGDRNQQDRLWDIPISTDIPTAKTKIQSNNYPAPPIYPGLYPSLPTSISPVIPKVAQPSSTNKYIHEFSVFNDLIDDNRDYQQIDHQLKLDNIRATNKQQANVII